MQADDPDSACLIADLDSLRQADLGIDPSDGCPRIVEAVRLGRLLCDKIAIPSNQILDGCVVLQFGPAGMLQMCGSDANDSPFLALLETDSLGSDLVALFRRLHTFRWSTLDALGVGATALQHIQLDLPSDVDARTAVRLLRAKVAHGDAALRDAVDWLAGRWAAWLDAAEAGRLSHRRWKRFTQVVTDPPAHWELEEALVARWRATARRSDVLRDIEELEVSDARKLEMANWWNDRYLQAIAEANETFWLRVITDIASGPTRRADGSDRALRLTGSAREEIRKMPGTVFAWVVYKCTLVQRTWEKEPDDRTLRRVAHVITQTSTPEDPFAERYAMMTRAGLAFVVAVLAGILQTSASGLAHGIALTLIVVVIGGMAAVPFGDLYDRWRNRKTELAAIVRQTE